MAMLRLNRPSVLVYGGTIDSGEHNGKKLDVVSAFEAWGEKVSGKINNKEYQCVIENACPGAGACGGMYTANTMASAIEAMGFALPYNSSNPATSKEKKLGMESLIATTQSRFTCGWGAERLIQSEPKPGRSVPGMFLEL